MASIGTAFVGVHKYAMKEIRSDMKEFRDDMARHEKEMEKNDDRAAQNEILLNATNARIDESYKLIIEMLKERKAV